jgi:hypothetical protein
MRTTEEREFYFNFETTDEPKPPIKVDRATLKKPVTIVPTALVVKWVRGRQGMPQWICTDATIYGNRVHSTSLKPYGYESVGVHYVGSWDDRVQDDLPQWAKDLLACTHPGA